ncbi:bromodomain-containing protein 8-like isoform X3 [Cloeon dipterum]|uniref:bromodomain-containing protein 8-like isoform X3 n=1 Tax=Cloeon dipterum TaxID=197152 RepID=UPI0032208674
MHKASVEETLKLKRLHVDQWSIREQLALASSVLRSGDQNWASVSRAIKPYGEKDRPNDWFSQKNCALQYEKLLENVETPKRRRGDKAEESKPFTPGELIVEKLRSQRLEELQAAMENVKKQYAKTKQEYIKVSINASEEYLDKMIAEMDEEAKQEEEKKKQHKIWLKEREEKINEIQRAWRPHSFLRKKTLEMSASSDAEISQDSVLSEGISVEQPSEEQKPTPATPTSPLLTHLLQSSATVSQRQTSGKPTIGSLLATSTPVKRDVVPFLPAVSSLASSSVAGTEQQQQQQQQQPAAGTSSPSSGAPTLSMLLELPPSIPGTPLPELPSTSDAVDSQGLIAAKPLPHTDTSSSTSLPVLQSTVESSKEFEEQLQKFDRNAVDNSQTNVLEELPQDVVELIEEVEEAAEAKKQQGEIGQFYPSPPVAIPAIEVQPTLAAVETKITPEATTEEEQVVKVEEAEVVPQDKKEPEPEVPEKAEQEKSVVEEVEVTLKPAPEAEKIAAPEVVVANIPAKVVEPEKPAEAKEEVLPAPAVQTKKPEPKEVVEEEKESEIEESSDDDYKPRPVNIQTYPARTKRNLLRRQTISQSAQSVTDESMPNSPVSVDDEKNKSFKKAMLLIWDQIAAHKNASIFLKPITNEMVAGYRTVVLRPMDLCTIKKNIELGNVTSAEAFQRDVRLIFMNAVMYNPSNHNIAQMAIEMQKDCQEEFQVYAAAQESKSNKRETREGSKRHDVSVDESAPPTKKKFVTFFSDSSDEES